jgi:hypothetical protein
MALLTHAGSPSGFYPSGTLARVTLAGGAPREILDHVDGADWTPDGSDLAVVHSKGELFANNLEFPAGKPPRMGKPCSLFTAWRFDRLC